MQVKQLRFHFKERRNGLSQTTEGEWRFLFESHERGSGVALTCSSSLKFSCLTGQHAMVFLESQGIGIFKTKLSKQILPTAVRISRQVANQWEQVFVCPVLWHMIFLAGMLLYEEGGSAWLTHSTSSQGSACTSHKSYHAHFTRYYQKGITQSKTITNHFLKCFLNPLCIDNMLAPGPGPRWPLIHSIFCY